MTKNYFKKLYSCECVGILYEVENEGDWPECSWSTGHMTNASDCPSTQLPLYSIYQRMRDRNRCNHRDYTNIGVNGARTGAMASDIIQSFKRNQTYDHPVLLFFALIGNDVCNGHPGLGSMTTPDEFKANVLQSLQYLVRKTSCTTRGKYITTSKY